MTGPKFICRICTGKLVAKYTVWHAACGTIGADDMLEEAFAGEHGEIREPTDTSPEDAVPGGEMALKLTLRPI